MKTNLNYTTARLLTLQEVQEYLQVGRTKLHKLRNAADPALRLVTVYLDGTPRVQPSDLQDYLARSQKPVRRTKNPDPALPQAGPLTQSSDETKPN